MATVVLLIFALTGIMFVTQPELIFAHTSSNDITAWPILAALAQASQPPTCHGTSNGVTMA